MPPTDRDRQIDALLARYRKLLEQRLPAGHYRLFVSEADSTQMGAPKAEIDVSVGKETTLELELDPAPN